MAFFITVEKSKGEILVVGCDTTAERDELLNFISGQEFIDVEGRIGTRKCDGEICIMLSKENSVKIE